MKDVLNGLFTALLLPALVTIITFHYQSRKTKTADAKSRMRLMLSLIKETIGLTDHAINSVKDVVQSLAQSNLHMPMLAVSAYPVAKFLQEKVLSDDYFIAYDHAYSNGLDAEKHYHELKYNTVFIHTQFEQATTMITDAYMRDHERRKRYIEQYQEAQDIVMGLYDLQIEGMKPYIAKIEQIGYDFVTTREEHDGRGNIADVQNMFVEPILVLLSTEEMRYKEFLPLILHLNKMHYLYRDITLQNDHMKSELLELLPSLENSLSKIKDAHAYLSSPQIMNLIS